MFDALTATKSTQRSLPEPVTQSPHTPFIAKSIPDWLLNTCAENRSALKLKGRHAQAFAQNSTVFNACSEELLNRHLVGAVSPQVYERELLELTEGRKVLLKALTLDALKRMQ
ncbi:hypothetical protein KW846_22290 [Pseudomonas sp. PDM32]|jgi:hypothetical protein|uniref:hypothetical protein n=1 Tax=Pseudomonas sp. PDM32 TaxID=2854768 RepID=UPI001C4921A8|nr:hypothetical protein [Pseudomonas sp. PDM32]MBV7575447.1 hypothetical protein [Pseudomonas sp. PDM32]